MTPRRLQPAANGRGVVVLPDLQRRADGQPVAIHGQAHRLLEAAEVRVEHAPVGPKHDQLAGLVGGDQDRDAQIVEDRGKTSRVHAAQGRQRFLLGFWLGHGGHIEASIGRVGIKAERARFSLGRPPASWRTRSGRGVRAASTGRSRPVSVSPCGPERCSAPVGRRRLGSDG